MLQGFSLTWRSERTGAGKAGEKVSEAVEAATIMGRIGTFFKLLSAIGFVISTISEVIEAIEGAKQ